MDIMRKYIERARERMLQHLPLGDCCEYCGVNERQKDDTCGKCGAPMKPFLGLCAGMPIDAEDFAEAQRMFHEYSFTSSSTAVISYRK
jgi:predicted amidophosphoribosyltransferase